MSDKNLVGTIANAAAPIVATGINAWSTARENKKNRLWTERQNDLAYARQLAMVKDQRAYDTPKAQMQRLMDAGLNPNLIYDGVNQTPLQALNPPDATGKYSGIPPQIDPLAMSQAMLNLANAQKAKSDSQLSLARVKEIFSETPFSKANLAKIQAETNRLVQDYNILFPDEEAAKVIRNQLDSISFHWDDDKGEYVEDGYKYYADFAEKVSRLFLKKFDVQEKDMDFVIETYLERCGLLTEQRRNYQLHNADLSSFVDVAAKYYQGLADEQSALAAMAVQDNEFVSKFGGRAAFNAIADVTSELLSLIKLLKRSPKSININNY